MTRRENILLLATCDSVPLADKVALELQIECTPMVRRQFADGESYHAFPRDVSGVDMVIISSTQTEGNNSRVLDKNQRVRRFISYAETLQFLLPAQGFVVVDQSPILNMDNCPAQAQIPAMQRYLTSI